MPAVLASFDPAELPMLWPQVYCIPSERPELKRRFERGLHGVVVIACRRWSCSRSRRSGRRIRGPPLPAPVVGFMVSPTILLVMLRRKRLRPWLPTYATVKHGVARQLLLHRGRVLQDALRNPVSHAVGARLKSEIRIVDVVAGVDLVHIERIGQQRAGRDGAADAVVGGRLQLVFGLARTVVIAGADAQHGLVLRSAPAPSECQAGSEILLRRGVPVARVLGNDGALRRCRTPRSCCGHRAAASSIPSAGRSSW